MTKEKEKSKKNKAKYSYTNEWKVLEELSLGNGMSDILKPQIDASFNKKIYWFLKGGAVGIIVIIDQVLGKEAVSKFYEFIDYYISHTDKKGHYHLPDTINKKIEDTALELQDFDFERYLKQLKQELIDQDAGE